MKKVFSILFFIILTQNVFSLSILIPMDNVQKNHLKAYGIVYWSLAKDAEFTWLLNYRGGSFLTSYSKTIENECKIRGVTYESISEIQVSGILQEILSPEVNMDAVKLYKAPKIAVYAPKHNLPWDDAVVLALTYAEIPYDLIYDEEVIQGLLPKYDWLHLHHEDFTGQYGKFWSAYKNATWYLNDVKIAEESARKLGFTKTSQLKNAVAKKIRDYVAGGGFLFAMCSAPDSYDIALAADGVDICDVMFDGDPIDQNAQSKLNFDNCFAFTNFKISTNPYEYEVSNIDATSSRRITEKNDLFTLFDFSAKWDPIPSMLCQNHETVIKGFMGQTTAFVKDFIKPSVVIMGENKAANEARYVYGEYGKGFWAFYGGHDPEDYQHMVGDPKTDLSLHPNSPGYRLILNNVLFPSAKKKKQKT